MQSKDASRPFWLAAVPKYVGIDTLRPVLMAWRQAIEAIDGEGLDELDDVTGGFTTVMLDTMHDAGAIGPLTILDGPHR